MKEPVRYARQRSSPSFESGLRVQGRVDLERTNYQGLHDEAKRLPLVRDKGKMPHQLKMERNELEEVQ